MRPSARVTFWVLDWVRAFVVTVAIEAFVATPLLGRVERRIARRVAAVVLVNLATHPLVWFLFPGLAVGHGARLTLSETWAVLGELGAYLVIWPTLGARQAAVIAVLANAASFAVGFILSAVGPPR